MRRRRVKHVEDPDNVGMAAKMPENAHLAQDSLGFDAVAEDTPDALDRDGPAAGTLCGDHVPVRPAPEPAYAGVFPRQFERRALDAELVERFLHVNKAFCTVLY